jgi:hypothetical protein
MGVGMATRLTWMTDQVVGIASSTAFQAPWVNAANNLAEMSGEGPRLLAQALLECLVDHCVWSCSNAVSDGIVHNLEGDDEAKECPAVRTVMLHISS